MKLARSGVKSNQNAQRFQIYQYQTVVKGFTIFDPAQKRRCFKLDFGVVAACQIAQAQNTKKHRMEQKKMAWMIRGYTGFVDRNDTEKDKKKQ